MATMKVRYLTVLPGRACEPPRYYWQPSSKLRAQGWRPQRVPLNWQGMTDPAQLQAAAIARAEELNAELDRVIQGAALAALRPPPPVAHRTLGELCALYRATDHFRSRAETTQRGYRQCLLKLEAWGGDAPVRAIDTPRVRALQAALSATPAYANATVRVLRLLLEHARGLGWVTDNAALRPHLAGTEPTGLIWPREAVKAFVEVADRMGRRSVGDAVLLNEWLGQRQADILRMPRAVYRQGSLVLRQRKTGAGVALPVDMVAALKDRLAAAIARTANLNPRPSTIIVSEETGLPYKADNFRHVFAQVRAAAAKDHPKFEVDHLAPGRDMTDPDAFTVRMIDLTFMMLRHTAVTRQGEAGCSPDLIRAITGHAQGSIETIMKRYMVRTRTAAIAAFQARLDAEAPPVKARADAAQA